MGIHDAHADFTSAPEMRNFPLLARHTLLKPSHVLPAPRPVLEGPAPLFRVAAGSGHTAVLDTVGSQLYSFGEGEDGQLVRGPGACPSSIAPVNTHTMRTKRHVNSFSCVVPSTQQIRRSPARSASQGLGDAEQRTVPTVVTALAGEELDEVYCGSEHTFVLSKRQKKVWSWGW